jgi:N,N'-diacetylchitobiose transport system permease protein
MSQLRRPVPAAHALRVRRGRAVGRAAGWRREERVLPWLLLLPAALATLLLIAWPVCQAIYLSFTDASLKYFTRGEANFVGLEQYREIWADETLRRSFVNTLVLGWGAVAGTMLLGVGVALLLNNRFRGRALLSVCVLLPWAVPGVAATTVWRYMFNADYGVINWFLVSIGLDRFDGYFWLADRWSAFAAVALVVIWQSFPFIAISVLAGLQTVSRDALEAAAIDGAGAWARLRHIVWPALRPLLAVLLILSTIWDFKLFDQLYVMTQGGPSRLTENIPVSTYVEGFAQRHFGTASALSVVLFLVLMIVALIYMRLVAPERER